MKKILIVLLTTVGLVASGLAAPAYAEPPSLPEAPNVVDAQGDATTDSSQGDLWHAWFTEDGDKLSIHWNNAAAPPPAAYGTEWRLYASPDAEGTECLVIRAQVPAGAYVGSPIARIFNACDGGSSWFSNSLGDGEVEYGEMAEGGYITATFDKSATPLIADGATISAPRAEALFIVGHQEQAFQPVLVDDSDPGTDYQVGGGSGDGESGDGEAEPDESEEPKKENCKKYKKKKKRKACKKRNKEAQQGENESPETPEAPSGNGCAAYVPGEEGAEAETFEITDEATADAPLEITIEQAMGQGGDLGLGVYDGSAHTFRNLQIDSAAPESGLFIRYEFPAYEDHDLYVNYADGSEAAHVGGFNPAPVPAGGLDGTGSGGHSEQGAEQIDGLRTPDCAGYTVDFSNYLGGGGEYVIKVWLGEIQNDPAPPASEFGKSLVF